MRDGLDAVRERCSTLSGFIKEAWPIRHPGRTFFPNWHIDLIAAHLEAVTTGKLLKLGLPNMLIFNIPPRCMKTELVSIFWPAFEWGPGGLPNLRYLSTSYSDQNVRDACRAHRDLVDTEWYRTLWPEVSLVRRAETDFDNSAGGRRLGRPFGSLTGQGGERTEIDDPHSTETAESDADRKRAERIFRESVISRVNDVRSATIIIMQRLHEGDISGLAMSLGLGYLPIVLPMEFEPDRAFKSPLGKQFSDPRTKAGDLLWPSRFPREYVDRMKISLGAVGTAGQFQQRPAPRGGLMFKRSNFQVVDAVPADVQRVRGWDFAASETKGSAFTCGVKLARDRKGIFYIENIVRERTMDPESLLIAIASQDGRGVTIDYPQDPGQAGKVQRIAISRRLAGFTFFSTPESGDKEVRAQPMASQSEAGNFRVLRGPWNETFFNELELFPNSAFKDQIDALSRAFGRFVMSPSARIVVPLVVTTPSAYFGDNPHATA